MLIFLLFSLIFIIKLFLREKIKEVGVFLNPIVMDLLCFKAHPIEVSLINGSVSWKRNCAQLALAVLSLWDLQTQKELDSRSVREKELGLLEVVQVLALCFGAYHKSPHNLLNVSLLIPSHLKYPLFFYLIPFNFWLFFLSTQTEM